MPTAGPCSVPALWISSICPLAHPSRKPWMSAAPAPLGIGASLPRATPSWLHFGAGEMSPRVSPAHLGRGTCCSLCCSPCVPSSVGANNTTTPGRALVAPTFLALKTGREQAALLFSVDGAGTGPSGCSRDTAAARGGRDAAPRAQRAASLHPCPGPILSFGSRTPAQGCGQTLRYLTRQQGRVDPTVGHQQLRAWLTCPGSSASSAVPLAVGRMPAAPGIRGHSAETPACEECRPCLVSPLKPCSCPSPGSL